MTTTSIVSDGLGVVAVHETDPVRQGTVDVLLLSKSTLDLERLVRSHWNYGLSIHYTRPSQETVAYIGKATQDKQK